MEVVFFGSSPYCLPVLDSLKENFALKLVITRSDKPVGRKKILTPSATKLWAQKNNIPISTLKTLDFKNFDLAIVADFGQIIPEEIFNRPRLGTWNIHFSKLPDLRGASPVQACLLRGDTTAWITIFKLEKTLDTGPILWLFQEAAKELPKINFSGPLTVQEGAPTFCKKLSRDNGFIDWTVLERCRQGGTLTKEVYNKFRAFSPWPGIWSIDPSGKRMKILKCHLEKDKLILDQIQFAGEKPKPTKPSQLRWD